MFRDVADFALQADRLLTGTRMQKRVDTVTSSAAGTIRIGVSGWRYPPWRGAFYPKGLPQRRELEYASRRFSSIELNGSFYSLQRPESYARWYAETPSDFVFSVKGPRFITHLRRLSKVEKPLANFLASGVANLREKLGPILWQLPRALPYDPDLLDAFLSLLPRDTDARRVMAAVDPAKDVDGFHPMNVGHLWRGEPGLVPCTPQGVLMLLAFGPSRPLRHALEVRHESFVDPSFIDLLRKHAIAFVIADTAHKWPEYEDVTADFVYIRLHGGEELYVSGYSDDALGRWGRRIRQWCRGKEPGDARRISPERAGSGTTRDVFCYFDNTAKDEAPRNAIELSDKLGVTPARGADWNDAESARRLRR